MESNAPTHKPARGVEHARPTDAVLASGTSLEIYSPYGPEVQLNPQAISPDGGSQPHDNVQPFLCINYIISLLGIFPSPT